MGIGSLPAFEDATRVQGLLWWRSPCEEPALEIVMNSITVAQLAASFPSGTPPLVIDIRRREAFVKDGKAISGALRRELHTWNPNAYVQAEHVTGAIAMVLTSRSV